MSLRLGRLTVVVASTAVAAKEILQTHDKNFSGRFFPYVYYKVPAAHHSSISMSEECNDTWKSLRAMGRSIIFSPRSVELKADIRLAKVGEVVEYLRKRRGEVVGLDDLISATLTNVVSNWLLSRDMIDIGSVEDHARVSGLVKETVDMVSSLGLSDLFWFMRVVDFQTQRKSEKIIENNNCLWGDMVRERRRVRSSGEREGESEAPDFLDLLLAHTAFDDHQICILFMELLIAGSDSSIITSIWLVVELLKHPNMLQRLRHEVAEAFNGSDTISHINESILTQSPYLQACIKETLRLHIPGPFFAPHRAIESCKIGDYVIPKDSIAVINGWALSMEEDSWEEASSFDPGRFLDRKTEYKGSDFEFIPFSAGRRMCPGWNAGVKNIQLLVAALLHYFDWTLPDGGDTTLIDTAAKFGTSLRKEKPLCLVPIPRE